MNTDIIDKFTTHLKSVLTRALCLVLETKETAIEPLHLFWALATQKGSIGAEILHKAKVAEAAVEALFKNSTAKLPLAIPEKEQSVGELAPKLGALAKRAIEKAVLTANIYEHKYVGTEHLLSGLLQIDDAAVKKFFEEHMIELKTLKQQVTLVLKSTSKFPDLAASLGVPGEHELSDPAREPMRERRRKKVGSKTPALDFFSVDLTNPDVQANVDPVIGREAEIERTMQILCRRTKNNPILLGDPGVGKTALVEGLAKKIGASEVPEALRGKRILALDLSLIVAGTMYRGEFEGRLKQIIDEVRAHPDIVLFIDEVHTIIGAGSASGSLDAANILKPALSRGEIRCIGATTLAEYKKHIESDPALERRFQSVMVNEPTPAATRTILEGIKKNYEAYHGVLITKEAIAAAVDFADRYLQEKFFPDKAIDLIDEAASALRIREKPSGTQRKIHECEEELARIREEKRQAVVDERFIEAISLKEQERALEEDLRKLERKVTKRKRALHGRVTARHIAEIVSRMTGVPVLDLLETERKMLLELEGTLSKRILGQEAVVKTVADCVRRAKAGIAQPNRPLASFLFVGPSGVGKTELAKTLAEEVFQDKDALIRLDMSEFSEGFTISKLIGAPAGYVGYK
ncbi:ATP-dependent Clp protease ATP-binding subunit, partial [Candidatus Uhrbacteria bacterium]|nr:ATP-dependent Clp protease ATP-binding subunit [Candidatus Uhrbacteria bacterium]